MPVTDPSHYVVQDLAPAGICGFKGERGTCSKEQPSEGKHCPRHACTSEGCANGKESSKEKCDACISKETAAYIEMQPEESEDNQGSFGYIDMSDFRGDTFVCGFRSQGSICSELALYEEGSGCVRHNCTIAGCSRQKKSSEKLCEVHKASASDEFSDLEHYEMAKTNFTDKVQSANTALGPVGTDYKAAFSDFLGSKEIPTLCVLPFHASIIYACCVRGERWYHYLHDRIRST